ncbi:S8 family serine peptidase [Gloeocapsa sp. PCC 73106]|uniref:S8 family serine peptidase n=1 Tax=Gloeocapsa sp. PCC 73106 TaxID=102232 RepID=UPI0002AC3BAD|nr:S8 family serine peptidase [Gloeocapsa sp. PCC 73106]ELR99192.1 subtilase family protease [Gloeocapsa sp. PCC 73106]
MTLNSSNFQPVRAFQLDSNFEASLEVQKNDPLARKIGFELAELYHNSQNNVNSSSFRDDSMLQFSQDGRRILTEFVAHNNPRVLLSQLQSLGLTGASIFGRVISGDFPISQLETLENLNNLNFARPVYTPITNIGATTSQADASMRADIARSSFGVDGRGVTVGVLSDSYNFLGGASRDISTGDLPGTGNPFGNTTPIRVLADEGDSDEGRAMLQLIHDVAPGSSLAFHTAFRGAADFANGIVRLADAGARVIVDDVGYLTEPFFQDGIIAQAADQVFARGVPYFSSAGNSGRDSYESVFRGANITVNNAPYLAQDFDPGSGVDVIQNFRLDPNESILLSFQWDQPHAQTGGRGSANDLDLFVVNSSNNIIAESIDDNLGGDAVEFFFFENPGSTAQTFGLVLAQFLPSGGPTPGFIKYIDFRGGTSDAEYYTNSSTTFGHPNAAGARGVGAAAFFETPAFGVNPPRLESFSSAGGTPILFDRAGNRLATPIDRRQPTIVAPDGTNTTFFGRDIAQDADTFPNFFGTSAAAPHAAAVAALMLEAKPNSTPTEIYNALEQTAINMGTPGFDRDSGFGLIQADAAIQRLIGSTSPTVSVRVSPTSVTENGTPNLVYTFTRTGSTSSALSNVNVSVGGTAIFNNDYTQTGASSFNATTGRVNFAAGLATATVTINPTGDTIVEPNETAILTLATGTGYTVGSPNAATGTITNDDGTTTLPTVNLRVSPTSVPEAGTGVLLYTFSRNGTLTSPLGISFTLGGTATVNTDYNQSGASLSGTNGQVTFAAGQDTAVVVVDPRPDTLSEGNETVSLTLNTGSNYNRGTTSAVTGTITNVVSNQILFDRFNSDLNIFMGDSGAIF